MELPLADAARIAGVSARRLQQATAAGDLPPHRVMGRTQSVDSAILLAFMRSARSGRRWGPRSRRAVLDLLTEGETDAMNGSELSRLRSNLRHLGAPEIAHRLGATSNWHRYRSLGIARHDLANHARATGPSILADPQWAELLGLLPGPADNVYGIVDDLTAMEAKLDLLVDAEGDIFLVERSGDGDMAEKLVDLFLFGDTRGSAAAATELQRRAGAC